jgi:hypothetical protein
MFDGRCGRWELGDRLGCSFAMLSEASSAAIASSALSVGLDLEGTGADGDAGA